MYLKEMSRVPLLKADEEFELAIHIEGGRKARMELLRCPGRKRNLERQRLQDAGAGGDHWHVNTSSKPTHAWW